MLSRSVPNLSFHSFIRQTAGSLGSCWILVSMMWESGNVLLGWTTCTGPFCRLYMTNYCQCSVVWYLVSLLVVWLYALCVILNNIVKTTLKEFFKVGNLKRLKVIYKGVQARKSLNQWHFSPIHMIIKSEFSIKSHCQGN